jgi:hypothetical protein
MDEGIFLNNCLYAGVFYGFTKLMGDYLWNPRLQYKSHSDKYWQTWSVLFDFSILLSAIHTNEHSLL